MSSGQWTDPVVPGTQNQRLISMITRRSLSYAQTYSRRHVEGAMNSLVIITRHGRFDTEAGEYDSIGSSLVYDDPDYPGIGGQAGISVTNGPISFAGGDEPSYFDSITVYIPKHIPIYPRIDDAIQVIAGPDTDLQGRFFRITAVPAGGRLLPSNAMQASGISPSKQWGPDTLSAFDSWESVDIAPTEEEP